MGRTALFGAAMGMNPGIVDLLAARRADPNIRDKQGCTALDPDYVAPNGPNCAISRRLLN
ncbi:MAG: hypothetical protein ACR2I2_02850 [Bryobacteraceae bacterium]